MAVRHWLVKSDPETFSFDDLERSPRRTTSWDGVRNYQARNYLRDEMREGDRVLFYHSQEEKAVVGTATVTRAGYPDATDPDGVWYAVDLRFGRRRDFRRGFDRRFRRTVTLDEMRGQQGLAGMVLLRKGSRLSVQPVTAAEWKIVEKLGG